MALLTLYSLHSYQTAFNRDGLWIEFSTDGGETWTRDGVLAVGEWYNARALTIEVESVEAFSGAARQWSRVSARLNGAQGESDVL